MISSEKAKATKITKKNISEKLFVYPLPWEVERESRIEQGNGKTKTKQKRGMVRAPSEIPKNKENQMITGCTRIGQQIFPPVMIESL